MHNTHTHSRRQLLKTAALAAASLPIIGAASSLAAAPAIRPPSDGFRGLKIGVASYTFRKFSPEDMIKGVKLRGNEICFRQGFSPENGQLDRKTQGPRREA